jgi:putative sugar O-methyltransferase
MSLPDAQRDEPSRFWRRLAAAHARDLERFGYGSFKRHQALRYFNWTWRLRRALTSEQLRFLVTHTPPRTWISAAIAPMDLSDGKWAGCDWPRHDRRFYTFAVRLLWDYAEAHGAADVLGLPEPRVGDPLPVFWKGRLISQDMANSALEVSAMRRALGERRPRSILEVGAGYGRTAYALLNVYPEAEYTIVDIDPALGISRWYLSRLFPSARLKFLTPEEAGSLAPASMDLAISISSLHEMTAGQIEHYLGLFDRVASGGVVFLKQWAGWRNPDDELVMRFTAYPIPGGWEQLFRRRAAVQSRFLEAAWAVSASAPG